MRIQRYLPASVMRVSSILLCINEWNIKPSFRVCILKRSPSPEIGTVAIERTSGIKNTLGVHSLVCCRSRVCGCCRPASGHTMRAVSDSGPPINQGLSNPELGKYGGSMGSCTRVLCVSFSCFPRFSLVLDPRGWLGLGCLGRKIGNASDV